MDPIQKSREELEKEAKRKSDLADLKQHADKLILGFENSSPVDAKRALWELIQNARDLSDHAVIEVVVEPHQLSFTHYGESFDSNTLLCLIKQVSSKSRKKKEQKGEAEEVKEVGQYGTGFITTHSFGKRFLLDGSLELQPGEFISLEGFEIDRIALDSEELSAKLLQQQAAVFKLIKNGISTTDKLPTTFRYQFDNPIEEENAKVAISEMTQSFIPFVMSLNQHVRSISILNKVSEPFFSKSFTKGEITCENGITAVPIHTDDLDTITIYKVHVDKDLDLTLVLPIENIQETKRLPSNMSRLFLYFPLIGTENFGSNFIMHCGLFNPHEKRDGIFLASDNPQNTTKESNNRAILEKASNAVFDFVSTYGSQINNPILLASIAFPTATGDSYNDQYFKGLKAEWVAKFKTYNIVETSSGRHNPASCYFLAEELLLEEETIEDIYALAAQFWNPLPLKNLIADWTRTIINWEDPQMKFISIKDICTEIQKKGSPELLNIGLLQSFYRFLLRTGNHRYFDDFRLLPTFSKKLSIKTGLFKATPLHPLFIEMATAFAPKVPDLLVQNDFIQQHTFTDFSRNELSKHLNPVLRDISTKLNVANLLPAAHLTLLLRFCSSYPSIENKGSRGELMEVITAFYAISNDPVGIPNAGEDKIDYSTAAECLIRHCIYDMFGHSTKDTSWTKNNIGIVKKLLVVLTNNKEYSGHLLDMPIFINLNYNLITREKALIQKDIPDSLKTMYYNIFKKDKNDELLHEDIVPFLKDGKFLEGTQLALEITQYLNKNGAIEQINNHPDSKLTMEIIKRISDPKEALEWSNLFPAISAARAVIVMAKVTEEKTKENLFSIISLDNPEKIAMLGDLAKNKDMALIIEYGMGVLVDKEHQKFDFDLKHSIGKHIENLLRSRIDSDLKELTIDTGAFEEQHGKDIIIKNGKEILYYIEVKSRWRSDYSIRMSKTQAETSVKKQDRYALIGINMVGYYPAEGDRHTPADIMLIMDRVTVISNIGELIDPLINNAMKRSGTTSEVYLSPDYAIVVPQATFQESGKGFSTFMDDLVNQLQQEISALPVGVTTG